MKKLLLSALLIPFIAFSQVPNMLKDLTPGSTGSSNIGKFSVLSNNDVIFSVSSPSATAGLWKTDGSTSGTNKYKSVTPYIPFIDYANKKFFLANTPGYILWKTDGTTLGTDSIAAPNLTGALYFTICNNILYFLGSTAAEGNELWRTDGTTAGTYIVKDIWPGTNYGLSNGFGGFFVYNNELYFRANDGISGEELWKSDGTSAGTTLLKDINVGSNASNISAIRVGNNGVYFVANDGVVGSEPWFTSGTTAGTNLIYDLNVGPNSSFASPQLFISNNSYFTYGQSIIKSSGTTASTSSITISQTTISPLYLFNNKLHYVAKVSAPQSDTFKLKSIDLNLANLQTIKSFSVSNFLSPNKAIFNQTVNSKMIITLWGNTNLMPNFLIITNGNLGNGKIFANPCQGADYTNGYSIAFDSINKKLYYPTSYITTNGIEPGYIDIQNDTIIQIKDITAGSASSYIFGPATIWSFKLYKLNNKNYFIAKNPSTGEEIYETDFTTAGTYLLKDIYPGNSSFMNPGTPSAAEYSYGLLGGIVTPNNIFFAANDGVNGLELWSFINSPNGINENKQPEFNLSLFPNPAKDSFTVKADVAINSLIVTDVLGKTIKEITVAGQSEIIINTNDLQTGIYFVTIKTNKGTVTKKVIKD